MMIHTTTLLERSVEDTHEPQQNPHAAFLAHPTRPSHPPARHATRHAARPPARLCTDVHTRPTCVHN